MRYISIVLGLIALMTLSTCGGRPSPVAVEAGRDICGNCRQPLSDLYVTAQIVTSNTDPVVFDDIQCLAEYLSRNTRMGRNAMAYVMDHQNGTWVPAATALYTRNLRVPTPRQSHLIAHGSIESQEADATALTGARVSLKELVLVEMPDGTR